MIADSGLRQNIVRTLGIGLDLLPKLPPTDARGTARLSGRPDRSPSLSVSTLPGVLYQHAQKFVPPSARASLPACAATVRVRPRAAKMRRPPLHDGENTNAPMLVGWRSCAGERRNLERRRDAQAASRRTDRRPRGSEGRDRHFRDDLRSRLAACLVSVGVA